MRDQPHQPGEIFIGNDVWVGANSVITRGVRIGSYAIIGAGSVVTSDVPEWEIAVGVPAAVKKFRSKEQ